MGDTGEGMDEAADTATAEAEGGAGGWRRPVRPVALVAGVIAGVAIVGGVVLAARRGDPSPSPEAAPSERSRSTPIEPAVTTATSTTLSPTTTAGSAAPVGEAAPTTAVPVSRPPGSIPPATQAPPRRATCSPVWPPGNAPMPTVFGGPDKIVAFGPPAASCVGVADGCLVAVTLRWSDGYTEVGSAVLAEPGQYTVNADRGTTWTFTVDSDRVCSSDGGNWSNVWPPGT